MLEVELPAEEEPRRRPVWAKSRLLIATFVAITLVSGIAIGLILSSGARAEQEGHLLKVSHSDSAPNAAASAAAALSEAFAMVARDVEPAVVHIETEAGQGNRSNDAFDFFRQHHQPRKGSGSGVLVDPAGFILTNHHVIEGSSRIKVKLQDGRIYVPEIIGLDAETDLAVLRIKRSESFPYAQIGDSDRLKVGDWVVAIGSPFGLEQTVTAGIISAKDRVTDGEGSNFQQFLQTDAAINPGNSGGPLISLRGEVVGINTQISTNSGVYNGIGFALPSAMIVSVYNQLVSTGRVQRGFLGILMRPMRPELARVFEIPNGTGVLVEDLATNDGPAAQAGLKSGDVIVEFDGEPVTSPRELSRKVAGTEIGHAVQVKYVREGKSCQTTVKVGLRPPREVSEPTPNRKPETEKPGAADDGEYPLRKESLGAKLEAVSPHVSSVLKLEPARGAIVADIEDEGFAEDLDLKTGDVIIRVNRVDIMNPDHFRTLLGNLKRGDPIVIEVVRPRRLGNSAGRVFLSTSVP